MVKIKRFYSRSWREQRCGHCQQHYQLIIDDVRLCNVAKRPYRFDFVAYWVCPSCSTRNNLKMSRIPMDTRIIVVKQGIKALAAAN